MNAQDSSSARKIINILSSRDFSGRGYMNKGVEKAADYLNKEFKSISLIPFNKHSYSQFFSLPVNTFPGRMIVIVDAKPLIPGVHYIIAPESKGLSGGYSLFKKDSVTYSATDLRRVVPLIVSIQKKLTWSVSTKQEDYTVVELLKDSFPKEIKNMDIQV
ncbi:MAG TPA: hypothetical protein VNX68_17260, partial [Nitrosopumilaceae archaeon]|nr:hypothetical protein [Nitrosopumilaceae archaeon]